MVTLPTYDQVSTARLEDRLRFISLRLRLGEVGKDRLTTEQNVRLTTEQAQIEAELRRRREAKVSR